MCYIIHKCDIPVLSHTCIRIDEHLTSFVRIIYTNEKYEHQFIRLHRKWDIDYLNRVITVS